MKFWKVTVIESERGWGQKVDHVKYFTQDQEQDAKSYVKSYNDSNTASSAPDWYMRADLTPYEVSEELVSFILQTQKKKRVTKTRARKA